MAKWVDDIGYSFIKSHKYDYNVIILSYQIKKETLNVPQDCIIKVDYVLCGI